MPIPAQTEVKSVLADFHARLRVVIDRAWQEWLANPDKGKYVFLPRVRAVLVFDAIARHALTEFEGDSNIRVLTKCNQTVHFLFADKVLVRFKKGNANGVGSNIQTQAVLDFIDPQGVIPGLVPEILKVEICYTPDEIGLELSEVAVVARAHQKRVWAYSLDRREPGAEIRPIPVRLPDPTPPRVIPRNPQADDETLNQE